MPNNIEGRGLTDREMLQLCLQLEKSRCQSISYTLLESSHEELRKIYEKCFNNASQNQYALYEVMSKKGWYKTNQATAQQVAEVQEFMQHNLNPES